MKVMVIVKATKNGEAGLMPSEQPLTAMGQYHEELVKAGVMLQCLRGLAGRPTAGPSAAE